MLLPRHSQEVKSWQRHRELCGGGNVISEGYVRCQLRSAVGSRPCTTVQATRCTWSRGAQWCRTELRGAMSKRVRRCVCCGPAVREDPERASELCKSECKSGIRSGTEAVPNVETWHGVSVRISDAGRRGGERRRYMYKNEVRGQEQTTTGYFPMGRESDGSAKRVARTRAREVPTEVAVSGIGFLRSFPL